MRPSPDSGLAVSEAMSNSGSPGGTGHPPPPPGGQHPHLQPQGSPIPGSNLVVRPQPARSQCGKFENKMLLLHSLKAFK